MATDTNKNPALSGDNEGSTTSRALTPPPRRMSNKKFFIILLLLAFIVSWAIVGLHIGQKVYAQAAGHKIYKQEVEDLIGSTKGVSDRQAATALADKYLTQAMAKEQGITVSDKEIQAAFGPKVDVNKQKTTNKYAYQLQVNQVYFEKLQAQYQGIYRGDLLVGQFNRYIPGRPLTKEQKAAIPKMGDQAAIADDKKYAQDFITNLYNLIQDGKITWEQAAQNERDDQRIGINMYPSLTHSGSFDTSKAPQPLFNIDSVKQKINSMKPGQTTKPFVVKAFNPVNNSTFETQFLVIRLDSSSGGQNNGNFQQQLTDTKKALGYKVNV